MRDIRSKESTLTHRTLRRSIRTLAVVSPQTILPSLESQAPSLAQLIVLQPRPQIRDAASLISRQMYPLELRSITTVVGSTLVSSDPLGLVRSRCLTLADRQIG